MLDVESVTSAGCMLGDMLPRRLYSRFLGPCLAIACGIAAAATQQGWVGIVLSIDAEDTSPQAHINAVEIETVVPSSPAAKAGVASGDDLLEIEGRDVASMTADVLKAALHKAVGEALHLRIKHGAEAPREVTIVAAPLPG